MFGWFIKNSNDCRCSEIIIAHRDPGDLDIIHDKCGMWVNKESKDIFSVTYDENMTGKWVRVGSFKDISGKNMSS